MKVINTPLSLTGPVGKLEAVLQVPDAASTKRIAILCHPLPTGGGTMNNKVVYTLGQVFHRLGMATVKFNTRGTGNSAGHFDQGQGETEDLRAVVNHCTETLSSTDIWLAGFSFGTFLVHNLCQHASGDRQLGARVHHQIFLAPPIGHYDFSVSTKQDMALTVVQGGEDEVVVAEDVAQWFQQQQHNYSHSDYICLSEASHFFHGQLVTLRQQLLANLSASVS